MEKNIKGKRNFKRFKSIFIVKGDSKIFSLKLFFKKLKEVHKVLIV